MSSDSALKALIERLGEYRRLTSLSYTERFEECAERFYRETHMLAPGKSVSLAMGGSDEGERMREWTRFQSKEREQYQADLADAMAALLSPSEPQEPAPQWQAIEQEKRCPAVSAANVTRHGTMVGGIQCGLPKGHPGQHTVLIPTSAPWFPSSPASPQGEKQ